MLPIETIKVDYLSPDEHYLKKLFRDHVIALHSSGIASMLLFTPRFHVKASGGGEEKWQGQKCHAPSNPS